MRSIKIISSSLLLLLPLFGVQFFSHQTSAQNNPPKNSALLFKKINPNLLEWKEIDTKNALKTQHALYNLCYNGIPIYGIQKKTSQANGFVYWDIQSTHELNFSCFLDHANPALPLEIETLLSKSDTFAIDTLFYPSLDSLYPVLKIEHLYKDEHRQMLVYDGKIISNENKTVYHHAQNDTIGLLSVFLPDPLTRAKKDYGGAYIDNNDADVPELNAEIVQLAFPVAYQAGLFKLEGPYAKITDHSAPWIAPFESTDNNFIFSRAQSGFEDVNAFYHVHAFHAYLESIGYNHLVDYPINIDTHGNNGADQSNFTSFGSPPRLTFGEGGVDDAEDADVIIHEYGHAVSHSAAPGTLNGLERGAMDEALGDYLAASYSKSIDDYHWTNVFSWDGHNEFFPGRSVESTKIYPEDLSHNLYVDAPIFSSALAEMETELGRDTTMILLLETWHGFISNMKMSDAAQLLMLTDSVLFDYKHKAKICRILSKKGFIAPCIELISESVALEVIMINSMGLLKNEDCYLLFSKSAAVTITFYNSMGQLVMEEKFNGTQYNIDGSVLSNGVYIMTIQLEENKWAKFKLLIKH